MKRLLWLIPVVLLAGCTTPAPAVPTAAPTPAATLVPRTPASTPTPVPTPAPTPAPTPVALDPLRLDYYSRTFIQPDEALYRLLFSAAEARQTRVDVSALGPDAEAVARARIAVMRHPEFRGLTGMTLEDGVITLAYEGGTPEDWQAQIVAFRQRAAEVLALARPGASQTEQALAVYEALVTRVRYAPGGATDACGALVDGQAMAPGFALALDYLLDQLGIESHITFAQDGSHLWNTALLDGQYYHLDAAYEAAAGGGSLAFFAMGDETRRASSIYTAWHSGDARYFAYDTPACGDDWFDFLSSALAATVDWDNRVLYWVDAGRVLHGFSLADGSLSDPDCGPALRVAWQDGFLYYLDARDYRTYCLDPLSGVAVPATGVSLAVREGGE